MNKIEKIMIGIGIAALAYLILPDLFIGPIDDTALISLATIAEAVLAITNFMNKAKVEHNTYESFDQF